MSAVKGTAPNGQVILDHPTDLPEGSRVLVEPITEEETSAGNRPAPGA
jgi:hypothetical protein